MKHFLPLRKEHPVITFIAVFGLGYLFATTVTPTDLRSLFVILCSLFLLVLLFFQGTWLTKLSLVLIVFPIIISIAYFMEELGFTIWKYGFDEKMSSFYENLMQQVTYILRLPLWYGIYCFMKKQLIDITKHMTPKMWLVIDGITIAICVSLITLIDIIGYTSTYRAFPACIACIIACLGSLWLCSYIARTITTEMENQTLKYQQSYYEELEHNQEQHRKLRHDMKHHLDVIGTFLRDEDVEQAKEYYQSLAGKFDSSTYVFCKNSIVNAVLNVKYNLAMAEDITCIFQVDIKKTLLFDPVSLCSLIANTMDNAIEAGRQIADPDKRFIQLKMRYHNNYLSYEITNGKQTPVSIENGKIKTRKPDPSQHGYGLKNVKDIVEKYQGTLNISYTEERFTVTILIKL
jgi:hypothetical protein